MSSLQKKTPPVEASGAKGENKEVSKTAFSTTSCSHRSTPLGEALVEDLLCGLSKKGGER